MDRAAAVAAGARAWQPPGLDGRSVPVSKRPSATIRELALRYRATGDRKARNDLVELHVDIADFYARKYTRRNAAVDDLRQVGLLAMVRAVDRYDPDRGIEFSTFASRTIEGEMKRYLRDHSHSIRPPRSAQELNLTVRSTHDELTHHLGRAPTVAEIADAIGSDVDHVIEALEVGVNTRAASLDAPGSGPDNDMTLADRALGTIESGYDHVEINEALHSLLSELDEKDRSILRMRFFENLPQQEIADRLGISQSYLSRVLRRLLVDLRGRMAEDQTSPLVD
jgi:RNA polymerase sigma-B factor